MKISLKTYLFSLSLVVLVSLNSFAPMREITLEEKLYCEIKGKRWEKRDAVEAFRIFPEKYGHTQQEIYDTIKKESSFYVRATSKKGGMGLMQNTRSAIRSIDDGNKYYRYRIDKNGNKVWIMRRGRHALHKKRIYRPYYNIKIGCQYLRVCKDMARRKGPQVLGRIVISTNELKDIFYVAGIGNYERCIKIALLYMQNTNQ